MMENSILLNEIRLLMRAFEKFIVKIDENFSVFESNFLYDLFDEKKKKSGNSTNGEDRDRAKRFL